MFATSPDRNAGALPRSVETSPTFLPSCDLPRSISLGDEIPQPQTRGCEHTTITVTTARVLMSCQDEIGKPDGLATPRMTTLALAPMAVR